MASFALARRMMVDGQIRTNDVFDLRLLAAFEETPRELFVPEQYRELAYLDRDIPVEPPQAGGAPPRRMLKPVVLARLIQAAEIETQERVLDVACGAGYSSAILARLAGEVVALEEAPALAATAERTLASLRIDNVRVRTGALGKGAPADGPFDVILVNGAVETLPGELARQLKDGGRLVCVLRTDGVGRGMLYRSVAGDLSGRPLFDAAAPLLPQFARPPSFVF